MEEPAPEIIISQDCPAPNDRDALDKSVGTFWKDAAPIKNLARALRDGVHEYVGYLRDKLCATAIGNCIDRAEMYVRYRSILLPLTVGQPQWTIDTRIAKIGAICNRANSSETGAVLLRPDQDFTLTDGVLKFSSNINNDARFAKYTDGGSQYIAAWALDVVMADDALYRNFAAAFGLDYQNDVYFRDLVKVLWDGLIGGFSVWHIFAFDAALRRLPLCRFDGEKVLEIVTGTAGYIKTDKTTYHINGYTPSVNVNDILKFGQPLLEGHKFFDFRHGTVPDDIEEIIVSADLLSHVSILDYRQTEGGDYLQHENGNLQLLESDGLYNATNWADPPGDLTLVNDNVPVTVNGYDVSWQVSNDPLVNTWFWQTVRMLELKYGTTLYELLMAKFGSIPAEINPAEFFATYVFRGPATVISLPTSPYSAGWSLPTIMIRSFVLRAKPRGSSSSSESSSSSTPYYTYFCICGTNNDYYYASGTYTGVVEYNGECYEVIGNGTEPRTTEIFPGAAYPDCQSCIPYTFQACDDGSQYWTRGSFEFYKVYRHNSYGCMTATYAGKYGTEISNDFSGTYDNCEDCQGSSSSDSSAPYYTYFRKCGTFDDYYYASGEYAGVVEYGNECYEVIGDGTEPLLVEIFPAGTYPDCQSCTPYAFHVCGSEDCYWTRGGSFVFDKVYRHNSYGCMTAIFVGKCGTEISNDFSDSYDDCDDCQGSSSSESSSDSAPYYTYFRKCGTDADYYYASGPYTGVVEHGGECYEVRGNGTEPLMVEIFPAGTYPDCQSCTPYTFQVCGGGDYYWTRGSFDLYRVYKHSSYGCMIAISVGRSGTEISNDFSGTYDNCDDCQPYYTYFRKCDEYDDSYYALGTYTGAVVEYNGECYEVRGNGTEPRTTRIYPTGTSYPDCYSCTPYVFQACDGGDYYWTRGGPFESYRVYKHSSYGCMTALYAGKDGTEISNDFSGTYDNCEDCLAS